MLIGLGDDYIQHFIVDKLKWLKEHPAVIPHIFHGAKRETIDKLREFVVNRKVHVVIGYPKEPSTLPAYVITVAGEQEVPFGLGDDLGTFSPFPIDELVERDGNPDWPETFRNEAAEMLNSRVSGTRMRASYKIECWTDNGDLTAFMYIILKWILYASKMEMDALGWTEISQGGTDLEPVPDYFPIFVYRRSVILNVTMVNLYHEIPDDIYPLYEVFDHPENYRRDAYGNITDENGNVVIRKKYLWIFSSVYYGGHGDYSWNWNRITSL